MEHLFQTKLLPAVFLERVDNALEVAEAIQRGGLNVMEIPFRTKAASRSINRIRKQYEDFYVGAGTLLKPDQVWEAKEAGAQFGLAPGFNPKVVKTAIGVGLSFIPGVTTSSEVEQALDLGCKVLKFFPAEAAGGIPILKALNGPFGHTGIKFIPMGGISETNMEEYLKLDNVTAVGGSWLVSKELIRKQRFQHVSKAIGESLDIAKKYFGP